MISFKSVSAGAERTARGGSYQRGLPRRLAPGREVRGQGGGFDLAPCDRPFQGLVLATAQAGRGTGRGSGQSARAGQHAWRRDQGRHEGVCGEASANVLRRTLLNPLPSPTG